MKRRIFRYGYSSIFVIVGFVISFFVFSYYNGVKHEESQELADRRQFTWENEIYAYASGQNIGFEMFERKQFEDINITMTDVSVFVDEMGYCCIGNVVLKTDGLVYPLVKGRYPTKEELASSERVVVLGQELKPYTKRYKGDDYITLRGDEYKVTGYLGCESSTVIDYYIINFAECLGDGLYKDIKDYGNSMGYKIVFQSNKVLKNQLREKLNPYFDSEEYAFCEIEENPQFYASRGASEQNIQYAIITYVFSVIVIILVIEYWLICRKREFAIRKAFGYTSDRLVGKMILELLIYLLIAIVISETLLAVFNFFEKRAVVFMVKDFYKRFTDLMIYAGITICILLVRPVFKMYSDNPVEMLIDKESL